MGDYVERREREPGQKHTGSADTWDTPWGMPAASLPVDRADTYLDVWDDDFNEEHHRMYDDVARQEGADAPLKFTDQNPNAVGEGDVEDWRRGYDGASKRSYWHGKVTPALRERGRKGLGFKDEETGVTPEGRKVRAKYVFGQHEDGSMRRASADDIERLLQVYSGGKIGTLDRRGQDIGNTHFASGDDQERMQGGPWGWSFKDPSSFKSEDDMASTISHELGHVFQLGYNNDMHGMRRRFQEAFPSFVEISKRRRGDQWKFTSNDEAYAYYLGDPSEILSDAISEYMRHPEDVRNTPAGKFIRDLLNDSEGLGGNVQFSMDQSPDDDSERRWG